MQRAGSHPGEPALSLPNGKMSDMAASSDEPVYQWWRYGEPKEKWTSKADKSCVERASRQRI